MKFPTTRFHRCNTAIFFTIITLAAVCCLGGAWPGTAEAKITQANESLAQIETTFDVHNPKIQAALAAQRRYNRYLLAHPQVVGTATGVDNADAPKVVVYARQALAPGSLPDNMDGIPVKVKVTGDIVPMQANYFPRPVPIGVSVGNKRECLAGTIAARVKDAQGKVYALSNNHVLALENKAPIGTGVTQPGLYDLLCIYSRTYLLGKLYDFEPISFTQDNIMDAAIASCKKSDLSNATPEDGYGKPKTVTAAAAVGLQVQKYGRTTGLTLGTITAINGTFLVDYAEPGGAPKIATFVNQIAVEAASPFLLPGDSGALLVTKTKKPVGLLFAGSANGTLGVANPIDPVLQRFAVTIDGRVPLQ
jgi:hypothetical protein